MSLVIGSPHYIRGSECGYCHDQKINFVGVANLPQNANRPLSCTHITVGAYVEEMTPRQYGEFMDRGFRRLGQFLYKGDMLRGCCRMYTIRTNMEYFNITKEHRQCVNRFKRAIGEEKKSKTFDLQSLIEAEQNSTRFTTRFEQSWFSKEKYELYKKYQVKVHKDKPEDVLPSQFDSFLCCSPFLDEDVEGEPEQWDILNNWVKNWRRGIRLVPPKRIGPAHELYYLDDKLIAISVLDFLPNGLSSIYFIWDPDYAHLSLGTFLGIREIQMCHELGLGHYYLGYYLSECPKMRYKAKFGGEILDVCNEVYVPLTSVQEFIAEGNFFMVRKSENTQTENGISNGKNSSQTGNKGNKYPGHQVYSLVFRTAEQGLRFQQPVTCNSTINICEEVYSDPQTYECAEMAMQVLKEKYGVAGCLIPSVFPGAIPMYQVLQMFEDGIFGLDFSVTYGYPAKRVKFGKLEAKSRGKIVDTLRFYGLDVLAQGEIFG